MFQLDFDQDIDLWRGDVRFDQPGEQDLYIEIANGLSTQSRKLNDVVVQEKSEVKIKDDEAPLVGASVTIYRDNPRTDEFLLWEAESYNQSNPVIVDQGGEFSIVLPRGEYYLAVEADGYLTAMSRVFELDTTSLIKADIELQRRQLSVADDILQLLNVYGGNHFEVTKTSVDSTEINQTVIDLSEVLLGNGVESLNLESIAPGNKILAHHASWNTQVQEQFQVLQTIDNSNSDVDVVLVSTLVPQSLQQSYIDRGLYGELVYRPNAEYYDLVNLSSLSYYLFVDANEDVVYTHYGDMSLAQLRGLIEEVF